MQKKFNHFAAVRVQELRIWHIIKLPWHQISPEIPHRPQGVKISPKIQFLGKFPQSWAPTVLIAVVIENRSWILSKRPCTFCVAWEGLNEFCSWRSLRKSSIYFIQIILYYIQIHVTCEGLNDLDWLTLSVFTLKYEKELELSEGCQSTRWAQKGCHIGAANIQKGLNLSKNIE